MIWLPGDEPPKEKRSLKIAAFPGPTTDAVGFFRMAAPAAFLEERGHKVVNLFPGCRLTDEQQAELVLDADVVWGVQPSGWWDDRHASFKETSAAIVVECDDDVFAWHADPAAKDPWTLAAVEAAKKAGATPSTPERVDQFRSWLKGADVVVTTTERLAAVFRREGAKRVHVCPNGLFAAFQRTQPRPQDVVTVRGERAQRILAKSIKRFEVPKGLPPVPTKRIGWTGSISHAADLSPALTAMRRIYEADASVEIVGLGPVDFKKAPEWEGFAPGSGSYRRLIFNAGEKRSATTPFCLQAEDGTVQWLYYRALEAMAPDAAVLPLRPSPFNETKSQVTLHSWGIQGVPCVVSRVGPYADAEKTGFPALYVDHDDRTAWVTSIRRLLYDKPFARELGEKARERVLRDHCFPNAVEPWIEALEAAVAAKETA